MRSRDLTAYRKLLLGRKREVSNTAGKQDVDTRKLEEEQNADPLDTATKEASFEMMSTLEDNEARQMEEIEYALEKIKNGVYGKCEECSQDITPARLKALPTARFCVSCKAKQEITTGIYTSKSRIRVALPGELLPLSHDDEDNIF